MPYWRLSLFYFFFLASVGAFVPYWSVYLNTLGFNAVEIGQLIALSMFTKVISPYFWGWIADHTGKRIAIVRFGALCALVSFCLFFYIDSFWWMAFALVVFGFFWNATLPQFEATTLNHLGADTHRYTQIRVWGSIGFIVAVAALGVALEQYGVQILPSVVFFLIVGILLASLLTPAEKEKVGAEAPAGFITLIARPEVLALFAVCFLMQASHGPYYTFFSIYLENSGYSHTFVGQMWALGVLAEVIFFLVAHRLFRHFSLRAFMIVGIILTTLRWILIAYFVDNLLVLLFVQSLHAASFGIYHAVAIQYIHRFFVGKNQGRGQALYSSLSFGLGGALGSLYSGYVWEGLGPTETYLSASALSFFALLVAWRWLQR